MLTAKFGIERLYFIFCVKSKFGAIKNFISGGLAKLRLNPPWLQYNTKAGAGQGRRSRLFTLDRARVLCYPSSRSAKNTSSWE